MPFWPGGLEWNPSETMSDLLQIDELLEELCFKKGILSICAYSMFGFFKLLLLLIADLKTVPPGFKNGMNFGSSDVNLNLASSLKLKSKPIDHEDSSKLIVDSENTSVIDLADLLKEKGYIFKWIEEDEPLSSKKENFSDLKLFKWILEFLR